MLVPNTELLFKDISQLIQDSRQQVARAVNSTMTLLYWRIGVRLYCEILKEERAEYGEAIIKQLAQKLSSQYGQGFSVRMLFRMIRFAKMYRDEKIVTTLSALLSWSHFVELIAIEEDLKRQFYIEMCRLELWSVRELRKKINGMLYERTALAHKPENIIQNELEQLQNKNEVTQELLFKDPYILDFLQLPAEFSESEFENAILDEMCEFLKELGTDFCFIARQKRIVIDNEDYYIDLLMYNRSLRRLIAIDLKLGKFQASYKGQMELYLRWLNKYEKRGGEKKPLGLILCAHKQQEHVELLELDKSGIHVAQYLTVLPSEELLKSRLHQAIAHAREKYKEE